MSQSAAALLDARLDAREIEPLLRTGDLVLFDDALPWMATSTKMCVVQSCPTFVYSCVHTYRAAGIVVVDADSEKPNVCSFDHATGTLVSVPFVDVLTRQCRRRTRTHRTYAIVRRLTPNGVATHLDARQVNHILSDLHTNAARVSPQHVALLQHGQTLDRCRPTNDDDAAAAARASPAFFVTLVYARLHLLNERILDHAARFNIEDVRSAKGKGPLDTLLSPDVYVEYSLPPL